MIANAKDYRIITRTGDLAVAERLVGRTAYTVIRMGGPAGNLMLMDLANRTTEAKARQRANFQWFVDKYGDAEGNRRYLLWVRKP